MTRCKLILLILEIIEWQTSHRCEDVVTAQLEKPIVGMYMENYILSSCMALNLFQYGNLMLLILNIKFRFFYKLPNIRYVVILRNGGIVI